jgi:hypothetical protein
MGQDWKWSLLQPNLRRAQELCDLDTRQLQDIGLKRNDVGQIVLAEDPMRVVPQFRHCSIISLVVDQAYRIARQVGGRVHGI